MTPDLRGFATKDDIRKRLQEMSPGGSSKKNDALACWQFVHDIRKGDDLVIVARAARDATISFEDALATSCHTLQSRMAVSPLMPRL